MAYDEHQADRIKRYFNDNKISYYDKKMMGGLVFMVDNKMCCALTSKKKYNQTLLMARIDPDLYDTLLQEGRCMPMDFTGRAMKGFVHIKEENFDFDEDLHYWLRLCLDYNPIAKASPKKTKS